MAVPYIFSPGTLAKSSESNSNFEYVETYPFAGDGSDGALSVTSGTTTLTAGTVYQYSTINISLGANVNVATTSTEPLIIKCSGDCTINGTIDLNGKGYAGGASVSCNNANLSGTSGTGWSSYVLSGATAGSVSAAGSSGASSINDGAGATKGYKAVGFVRKTCSAVWNGSGGAGGGAQCLNVTSTGGAGGAGGVGLILFVGGDLTITGTIDCGGADGSNASGGTGGSASGGGGGGAGSMILVYSGTLTNTGTTTASGGNGGTKAGDFNADGEDGADGFVEIIHLSEYLS